MEPKKEDLRVIRTRKLLQDALLELIDEQDYAAIKVQELCERAMVRKSTFYTHFADKDELLCYCVSQIRDQSILELETEDPKEFFLSYLSHTYDFILKHPRFAQTIVKNPASMKDLDDVFVRDFRTRLKYDKTNGYETVAPINFCCLSIYGLIKETIFAYITGDLDVEKEALTEYLIGTIMSMYK